jgi:phosphoribosylformylglycinamidine synthase subunit PurL
MPVEALVDGCPLYDLEPAEPEGWIYGNENVLAERVAAAQKRVEDGGRAGTGGTSGDPDDPTSVLLALLASPSIASKRWAFEQYDSVVGSRTARRPESADAAVLAIPEAERGIAISIDGNGRRVACDPYAGTVEAVLECTQNLACVGAEPLGLTNCLNFGNPEKPAPAWQLDRAVRGLADACEALGVPVVGGNVSLYNEGPEGPIYPTPVVGMVGELPDPGAAAPSAFAGDGDAIALVGPFAPSLAGSELAKLRGELGVGLPQPNLAAVAATCATIRDAVRAGVLASAHDVSDGGLACALAEAAIGSGLGCRVDLSPLLDRGCSAEEVLFGEGTGGFLVSGERARLDRLNGGDVAVLILGETGGEAIEIAGGTPIAVRVADAERAWRSLGDRLG